MEAKFENPSPDALLQHTEYLRNLARRLVRDPSAAEDLIQDTWLSVLERPPLRVGALRPWLAGVLRNLARERARGEGRRARRERAAARDEAQTAAGEIVADIESFRSLALDVVDLEEPYRSVIVLRYFGQRSAKEIAADQGIPSATVRSRQKRGLEKLRERLDRRHGGERSAWCLMWGELLRRTQSGSEVAPVSGALLPASLLLIAVGVTGWVLWRGMDAGTQPAERLLAQAEPAALVPHATGATAPVLPALTPPDESAEAAAQRSALAPAIAAPPRAMRPLVLRVVDRETGEPLPEFTLEVIDGDKHVERLSSDAQGLLVTDREFEAGKLGLYLIDHPELAAWRERPRGARIVKWATTHEHATEASEEAVLRLPVGPTCRLRFEMPPGLDLEHVRATLRATDPTAGLTESRAPLRPAAVVSGAAASGALPWVRFLAEATALGGAGPWPLELESADGYWRARCLVPQKSGVVKEPLDVQWEATGNLALSLDDATEKHFAATLELERLGAVTSEQRTLALAPPDVHGVHGVLGLTPGSWRVRVASAAHAPHETTVDVSAGSTTRLTLPMQPRQVSGGIHGTISTESGQFAGEKLEVELRAADGSLLATVQPAFEQRDGRAVAEYRFDDLPPGSFQVRPRATSVYRWSPPLHNVVSPADAVDFRALDAAPSQELLFKAIDAQTRQRVDLYKLRLAVDPGIPGGFEAERATIFGTIFFNRVPQDARFEWTLAAEGYVVARGDERAMTDDNRERKLVLVELVKGWTREVIVTSEHDGAPIAGAQIRLDGRVAASTGADGRAHVRAGEPPRVIEVLHRDWVHTGGSIDPRNASYATVDLANLSASMQPRAAAQER